MCLQVLEYTNFHVFTSTHTSMKKSLLSQKGSFFMLDIHLFHYILDSSFFPVLHQLHTDN